MKKRFFFPLFACLLLVFSCASAEIDLTAYEVPVFPIDSIKIIQPGLILTLTDGSLSDGQFPSSVTLLQGGQILRQKVAVAAEIRVCGAADLPPHPLAPAAAEGGKLA